MRARTPLEPRTIFIAASSTDESAWMVPQIDSRMKATETPAAAATSPAVLKYRCGFVHAVCHLPDAVEFGACSGAGDERHVTGVRL